MAKATHGSSLALPTFLLAMLLGLGLGPRPVHAQELLRVALFKSASDQPELRQLAAAVDSVLHGELGEVPALEVAALPALDLPGLQLAIDCVGETPECLRSAATQAGAEGLVAPSLTKSGTVVVLQLLLFDPRSASPIKAVTRNIEGQQDDRQALDALPGMVRELFDLPEKTVAPEAQPEPAPLPSEPPPLAAKRPSLLVPIILGGVGVALIGAGAVVGAVGESAQNDYQGRHVTNTTEADAAYHKYKVANTCATLADIGFAVGGAAIVAGVLVFVIQHGKASSEHARAGTRVELGLSGLKLKSTWD
jgi:hypothetical protein